MSQALMQTNKVCGWIKRLTNLGLIVESSGYVVGHGTPTKSLETVKSDKVLPPFVLQGNL